MKAILLKNFGGVDNLEIEEIPVPKMKPDEVLVQVKAIGIDPIDLKTREGGGMATKLCEEHPMILGWDIAGVVVKAGEKVQELKVGDPVFGTVRFPGCGNAYAEYVAAPASQLAVKPGNISFEEAAGATQSPLTAWQALIETGHIGPGDKVLIHGGGRGSRQLCRPDCQGSRRLRDCNRFGGGQGFCNEPGRQRVHRLPYTKV